MLLIIALTVHENIVRKLARMHYLQRITTNGLPDFIIITTTFLIIIKPADIICGVTRNTNFTVTIWLCYIYKTKTTTVLLQKLNTETILTFLVIRQMSEPKNHNGPALWTYY